MSLRPLSGSQLQFWLIRLSQFSENEEIAVTSIGGGPGTDFFALVAASRFLFPFEPTFRVQIFDRAYSAWSDTWNKLLRAVNGFPAAASYHSLVLPDSGITDLVSRLLKLDANCQDQIYESREHNHDVSICLRNRPAGVYRLLCLLGHTT